MLRITQSILIHNPEKMFLLKVFIKTHGNCRQSINFTTRLQQNYHMHSYQDKPHTAQN